MITHEMRLAALEELYDRLPRVACKGLCWNACGPIDMSTTERQRLTDLGVEIPVFTMERSQAWANNEKLYCPALKFGAGPDGGVGCSVYEARPMICRLWGLSEGEMACPHGCELDGDRISYDDVFGLIARSYELGGKDDVQVDPRAVQEFLNDPEIGPVMQRVVNGDRSALADLMEIVGRRSHE